MACGDFPNYLPVQEFLIRGEIKPVSDFLNMTTNGVPDSEIEAQRAVNAKQAAMDRYRLASTYPSAPLKSVFVPEVSHGPVPNLVSNLQSTLAMVRERNAQLEQDMKSQCEAYQCLYAQVLALKRMLGADENVGNHDYNGPADEDGRPVPDVVHERFHKAVGDVMAGDVMPKAREQMRKALDAAPKHEKTTASTGKPMPKGAIGFGQQVIGLRVP